MRKSNTTLRRLSTLVVGAMVGTAVFVGALAPPA
ncbi:MAG: hypothetical protein RL205_1915, partial [Actinomycetota bacterium]